MSRPGAEGLQEVVQTLQGDWERSHSKAYHALRRFCDTLDSHAPIFKLFPSDTLYTSTLSGALTALVQASVNHSRIADLLITSVVDLSGKVSGCSKLLFLINTKEMERKLATVYSKYFAFFCSTMEWFSKGKISRALDSFNENFSQQVEGATKEINTAIEDIVETSRRGNMALNAATFMSVNEMGKAVTSLQTDISAIKSKLDEVDNMRQSNYSTQLPPLAMGCAAMLQLMQSAGFSISYEPAISIVPATAENDSQGLILPEMQGRADVEAQCQQLKAFADRTGVTDGIELSKRAEPLIADPFVLRELASWMGGMQGMPQVLWIKTPMDFEEMSSATLASVGTIQTVAQANASFVACVCKKPSTRHDPALQSAQEAGCIALVYSLICQLIRFRPNDDTVELDIRSFERLARRENPWELSLEILERLLQHTPIVRFCIIDGINRLETDEVGEKMCEALIEKLLGHARESQSPMQVLFTTSGQSRVLHRHVGMQDRIVAEQTFIQTQRQGQYFGAWMLP